MTKTKTKRKIVPCGTVTMTGFFGAGVGTRPDGLGGVGGRYTPHSWARQNKTRRQGLGSG